MRIDILSAQPALLESPFAHSILKRAQDKGLATIHLHDLHDYSEDKHRKIDDEAYGGGAGMVIQLGPVTRCIDHLREQREYNEIIYLTADGEPTTQRTLQQLSTHQNLIFLCGHYKGVDERIREHYITRELSIGDFVLTGGELPAAILADGIIRLLPGVLNDETSALTDSFQDNLLAPPVYTRPADFRGWKVPEVLLSGDHRAIEEWRMEQALTRTRQRRPDLLNDEPQDPSS